jgi:hypothetical protein
VDDHRVCGRVVQFWKYPAVVFSIGRFMKGHIDNESHTIFGTQTGYAQYTAVHFYNFQLQCYRRAVDAWTIVGLRNKIVKDMRKISGR